MTQHFRLRQQGQGMTEYLARLKTRMDRAFS